MERIIRLVTDPTVKVRRISREVNFLSSQWTLERRGKFLEKIAALVIDLDCARQLAGSAFAISRADSHCPLQRTILMEASPPPSDGTL